MIFLLQFFTFSSFCKISWSALRSLQILKLPSDEQRKTPNYTVTAFFCTLTGKQVMFHPWQLFNQALSPDVTRKKSIG